MLPGSEDSRISTSTREVTLELARSGSDDADKSRIVVVDRHTTVPLPYGTIRGTVSGTVDLSPRTKTFGSRKVELFFVVFGTLAIMDRAIASTSSCSWTALYPVRIAVFRGAALSDIIPRPATGPMSTEEQGRPRLLRN